MRILDGSESFVGDEFIRNSNSFCWFPARCMFGPDDRGISLENLVKSDYGDFDKTELVRFDSNDELHRCFSMGHVVGFYRFHISERMREIFKSWNDWANFAISIIDDKDLYDIMFEPIVCPVCGMNLVRKKGLYGEFLGCTGYPKCSYTASEKSLRNEQKLVWRKGVEKEELQKAFFGVREMSVEEMHRCFSERRNA